MTTATATPYWVTNADDVARTIDVYMKDEDPSSVSFHNRCFAGMIEGGEATIDFFPPERRAAILAIMAKAGPATT